MKVPVMDISGDPGPLQAAAIAAVVVAVLEQEATVRARPGFQPQQPEWVLSGRPRPSEPPRIPSTVDSRRGEVNGGQRPAMPSG